MEQANENPAMKSPIVRPGALAPQTVDDLQVADAMSAGMISCSPETSLRVVARLMATYGVHAVFVFEYGEEADEDVRLWGVVTDLDLAAAAAAGVLTQNARECAVTPLVTVQSDEFSNGPPG